MKNFFELRLAICLIVAALFSVSASAQQGYKISIELGKPGQRETKTYDLNTMSFNYNPYVTRDTLYNYEFFTLSFVLKKRVDAFLTGWLANSEQGMNGKIVIKSSEDEKVITEYEFENMKVYSYSASYDSQYFDSANAGYLSVTADKIKMNGVELKKGNVKAKK